MIIYNNVPCILLQKKYMKRYIGNIQYLICYKTEIMWVFLEKSNEAVIYFSDLKDWMFNEQNNSFQ